MDLGRQLLVVVTRIDEIADERVLEREKKALIEKLMVPPANVYFHRNYVTDKNADKFIDQSSRTIMLAIKERAKVHFATCGSKYVDVDYSEVHPCFNQPDIVCSSCSTVKSIHWNGKFCKECGNAFPKPLGCERGHSQPFGWAKTFCGRCASKFVPIKIKQCPDGHQKPSSWDKDFCPSCGKRPLTFDEEI